MHRSLSYGRCAPPVVKTRHRWSTCDQSLVWSWSPTAVQSFPTKASSISLSGGKQSRECKCWCDADAQSRLPAQTLVDEFVKDSFVVGVDSGGLCTEIIKEIGARLKAGDLQSVTVVASCDAAASEAAFVGVPQAFSADTSEVDVMFSEVDEVDVESEQLPFVFGRKSEPAQPQMPRFRAVAKKAKRFVALLASEEQVVSRLGRELPVLVSNDTWEETAEEVDDLFIGGAEVWRRSAVAGSAPSPNGGPNPYVAADGSTILDVIFYGDFQMVDDVTVPYAQIVKEIMAIDGVRSVGLLEDVATNIAICLAATNKVSTFSKEQLIEASAAAKAMEEQEAMKLEAGEDAKS